jgi:beta-glucanase (GH16 family)
VRDDGRLTAVGSLLPGVYRWWFESTLHPERAEAPARSERLTAADARGGRDGKPPPGPGWELAFSDDFDDSSFDTTKWSSKYPRSGDMSSSNWDNGEAQWYRRQNISQHDGSLRLTAKREDTTGPETGRTFRYTSGLIHSKPSFNFRYGYMEARMWLPKGSGFWPAFWTWPTSEGWPPEIDAMEFYGDRPGEVRLTYHGRRGAASASHGDGTKISSPDWTTGWHTFAVNWEPGRLTWYVDGVAQKIVDQSPSEKMYLIANLAIANGERAPAPEPDTPLPSALKVDYIRVWER